LWEGCPQLLMFWKKVTLYKVLVLYAFDFSCLLYGARRLSI
jgi:hypothetical protein